MKMKDSIKDYSFISKLGLDFQDYGTLTKADLDLIQKWYETTERVKQRIDWRKRNIEVAEKEIGGFVTKEDLEESIEKLHEDELLLGDEK